MRAARYQFCHLGTDYGYQKVIGLVHGLKGQVTDIASLVSANLDIQRSFDLCSCIMTSAVGSGQENYHLPETFSGWIDEWHRRFLEIILSTQNPKLFFWRIQSYDFGSLWNSDLPLFQRIFSSKSGLLKIHRLHQGPRWGDQQIYEDYDKCYCPYNQQSARQRSVVLLASHYCDPELE